MQHKSPNGNVVNGRKHNYGFNGVEENNDLGLGLVEMDWRHYDPLIGRFSSIDPLADHPFQMDITPFSFGWNNPISYNDPSGLCPECPDASGREYGETHEVNGETYVIDQDGQWSRQGGELDEVVITASGGEESSKSQENESGLVTIHGAPSSKVAPAIGELRGLSKFSAEIQQNIFGKRTVNINGISYPVDPSGRVDGIGLIASEVNLPAGPGSGKNLVTKFNPKQLLKWWTNSSKNLPKIPKGFKLTKKFGFQHGQKVYQYKGKYYSRDIDSHNGGVWKVFEEVGGRLKRIGTANANLEIFKG